MENSPDTLSDIFRAAVSITAGLALVVYAVILFAAFRDGFGLEDKSKTKKKQPPGKASSSAPTVK